MKKLFIISLQISFKVLTSCKLTTVKKNFTKSAFTVFMTSALAAAMITSCTKESFMDAVSSDEPDASTPSIFAPVEAGEKMVANEILVKFKEGAQNEEKNLFLQGINAQIKEKIYTKAMARAGKKEGVMLIRTALPALQALEMARGWDVIEYAEPNFIYQHFASSDDTYYTNGSLWGMYGSSTSPSNQYGCGAGTAWAAGNVGSNDVYIGIIDEGYMYTHPELSANAGKNAGEIAGNGKDDDGNGLVDDVYGWDFDGNNNSVFDGAGDDHGTHVAGTIGGKGGNKAGVAGVCWNVKLLNAKFLGSRGGTTANAIKAVDYFTNLKINGMNIIATNNSWGGGGYSQALYDAIERANSAGILFIAAAGNSGTNNDVTASYPSGYSNSNIIAVAAITSTGGLASFSQYGANTVDIGAPGAGIWSTVPKSSKGKVTASYASYNGTSMATPHVSGAAALYAASHPGATAADIKAAILNSATATSSLSGKCSTGGRLNVSGF